MERCHLDAGTTVTSLYLHIYLQARAAARGMPAEPHVLFVLITNISSSAFAFSFLLRQSKVILVSGMVRAQTSFDHSYLRQTIFNSSEPVTPESKVVSRVRDV